MAEIRITAMSTPGPSIPSHLTALVRKLREFADALEAGTL